MRSVETHVPRRELRERMAVMRIWLDEHRFEPSVFNCRDEEEERILVHIEFKAESEAAAFAERFRGRLSDAGGATAGNGERAILRSALPGRPIG
ncbi:MAG: hypothetical protein ACREE4_11000 [Stellaceae bacterium]